MFKKSLGLLLALMLVAPVLAQDASKNTKGGLPLPDSVTPREATLELVLAEVGVCRQLGDDHWRFGTRKFRNCQGELPEFGITPDYDLAFCTDQDVDVIIRRGGLRGRFVMGKFETIYQNKKCRQRVLENGQVTPEAQKLINTFTPMHDE